MVTSTGPTLLAQIDTELQAIQAKLRDGTATGSNLGAILAASQTVMTALNLTSGNGLGTITEVPLDDDLHTWIAAAIVTETP